MIKSDFRVDVCSDLEYEDLIADIYFQDKFVAMITQEKGFKNLEIEIYAPKGQEKWLFKFSDFENVINHAKQRLWDLRKFPKETDRMP